MKYIKIFLLLIFFCYSDKLNAYIENKNLIITNINLEKKCEKIGKKFFSHSEILFFLNQQIDEMQSDINKLRNEIQENSSLINKMLKEYKKINKILKNKFIPNININSEKF